MARPAQPARSPLSFPKIISACSNDVGGTSSFRLLGTALPTLPGSMAPRLRPMHPAPRPHQAGAHSYAADEVFFPAVSFLSAASAHAIHASTIESKPSRCAGIVLASRLHSSAYFRNSVGSCMTRPPWFIEHGGPTFAKTNGSNACLFVESCGNE